MIFSPLTALASEIDVALRKTMNKQLFSPKRDDMLRLVKLRLWSTRYSVSISYILEKLIPHFEKMSSRHYVRRTAGPSKGIGISIATLTGPVAEEKLREFIAKDFPDDEHIASRREEVKARCLALMDRAEHIGRPKPILHHASVADYVASYTKRIERSRRSSSRLDKQMSKQSWRGNPWR